MNEIEIKKENNIEQSTKSSYNINEEINYASRKIGFLLGIISCFSIFYVISGIYVSKQDLNLFFIITAVFVVISFLLMFFIGRTSMELKYLKEKN